MTLTTAETVLAEEPGYVTSTDRLSLPWYAVRVRSNAEKSVHQALSMRGYEACLPVYRKRSRWSDRVKNLDAVLFPGYVFCRIDVTCRFPVISTPGVMSILSFGRTFARIPDQEIEAVEQIMRSGNLVVPWPYLQEGSRVRVVWGALDGLEGILIQTKNESRVVVSVTLLQRSVAVEIDRDWIQPVPSRPHHHCTVRPGR